MFHRASGQLHRRNSDEQRLLPGEQYAASVLSQGACTAIVYAAMIGLLLSIYRNERIVTDKMIELHRRRRLKISVKLEKR